MYKAAQTLALACYFKITFGRFLCVILKKKGRIYPNSELKRAPTDTGSCVNARKKWGGGDIGLSDNKWDASCLWRPLPRATVGNCTKIWGANLRPDTFWCLILLLLHITIMRLQICVLHSPLRGINQYFHTYCIWRAIGLNLRYSNRPPFAFSRKRKVTKMTHDVRNHRCRPGFLRFCLCWAEMS